MAQSKAVTTADLRMINEALEKGLDVRIHPDKYGLKITSERVHVLKKPEAPNYGFSDKRE